MKNLDIINDSLVIEVKHSNRILFVTEYENGPALTWRKDFAKKFSTKDEIEIYIKDNSLYRNYGIVKYSEAKNH